MRRGLVGVGLALTVVLIGAAGLVSVNAMARRTVNEKHIYGFKGKAVSVELAVGDIAVVPGTVDDQILVSRTMTYGLSRPPVEERIDGETFRISDGACAMPVGATCHVRWLLQVPPDLHLSITTEAGDINVAAGMTGAVNLVSDSGAVKARGLGGPAAQLFSHTGAVSGTGIRSTHVVATSDTGDIQLSFRAAPKFVQGKSKTGSVSVVLPEGDETYKVAGTSGGGRTITGVKLDDNSKRRINVDSIKGTATVEQGSTPTGS